MAKSPVRAMALAMVRELYAREPEAVWREGCSDPLGVYSFMIDRATEERLGKEIESMPEVYSELLRSTVRRVGLRAALPALFGFPTVFDARKFELARTMKKEVAR